MPSTVIEVHRISEPLADQWSWRLVDAGEVLARQVERPIGSRSKQAVRTHAYNTLGILQAHDVPVVVVKDPERHLAT